MPIDKETVDYVAHLSRIELQAKELERLSRQLQDIIDFIDTLKKANVDTIEATSHILSIHNVVRQDSPVLSLTNEEALGNSPQKEGNFFVVPKIIE